MNIAKYLRRGVFGEKRLKKIQKQGDYSPWWEDWKKWTEMGKSPRRMERDGGSVE